MRCESPDGAQPGLHAEPLNVTIGRLLALYRLGVSAMVIDGSDTTSKQNKTFSFTVRYDIVHHAYAKLE